MIPSEARFAVRVAPKDADGCIRWLGATSDTGYGAFRSNGKTVSTHRFAYEMAKGPIPKGAQILHSCDHRWCVNPEHLSIGTSADNMRDMIAKGRDRHAGFIGEAHPMAKLREADVREILRLLSTGLSQREVAAQFKVVAGTVKRIKAGRSWAHVSAEAIQ